MEMTRELDPERAYIIFTIRVSREEMINISGRYTDNFLSGLLESKDIEERIYGLYVLAKNLEE